MLNVKERPSDAIKLKKLKQNRQTKMDAGNGCDNQRIKYRQIQNEKDRQINRQMATKNVATTFKPNKLSWDVHTLIFFPN